MKRNALICVLWILCQVLHAQPPNDTPCGAWSLQVEDGLYCTPATPFSWENASNSLVLPNTVCGSQNARDVWFSFELDALSNLRVETLQGADAEAIHDGVMELYFGEDCLNLERIGCDDDGGLNLMPQLYMQLGPGTYYIRFWSYNGAPSGNIGGICVTASAPGPLPNDFCEGAIQFPAIPSNGDCASVYADTREATGGAPSFFEGTPAPDGDLWFRFTVPQDEEQLYFEFGNISGNVVRNISVHASCSSVNMGAPHLLVTGSEFGEGLLKGLVPGENYILRVFVNDLNSYSKFNLCLRRTPPPPEHDVCGMAMAFPDIPTDGTCARVLAEPRWATADWEEDCNGFFDPDVWFYFVVPDGLTNLIAEINPVNDLGAILGTFAVYSGSCGSLTRIFCSEGNPPQLYGLTPGETYFVRAHSGGDNGRFHICLRAAPPVPDNDACQDAIPFPDIPDDGTCAVMNINTKGSTGPVLGDCSFFPLDKYSSNWYSFEVPPGHTRLVFRQQPIGGPFNGLVAFTLFSGACGNLVEVGCGGATTSGELFEGLAGGQKYYLEAQARLDFWNETGVDMCIRTAPPTPAHDLCEEAIDFPEIALDGSWTGMDLSTLSASGPAGGVFCGTSAGKDIWVRISVPEGHDVLRYQVRDAKNGYMAMGLYEDNCTDLKLIACLDDDFSMHIPSLVGGQTYLIRVVSERGRNWSEFRLNLAVPFDSLLNDECTGALPFPTIPSNGDCASVAGETFQATGISDPTCSGLELDDIWYTFQVPAEVRALKFQLADAYGESSLRLQIYEGTCEELVHVACINSLPWDHVQYDLTPGGTYYLRVYSNALISSSGFTLCVSAVLPPPNDECVEAISITGMAGAFEDPGVQYLGGATVSPQAACGNYFIEPFDVWYSFETGSQGGDVEITVVNVVEEFGFNPELIVQVLEGTCESPVSLGCLSSVNQNSWDYTTTVNLNGLAPWTTYYIRIFPFHSSTENVAFHIGAQGSALTNPVAVQEAPAFRPLHIDRVFPVPTNDRVEVHYSASGPAPVHYQLYAMTGNKVQEAQVGGLEGKNAMPLSLAGLPSGIYFLVLFQHGVAAPPVKLVKQ